jgi:ATP-dependent RNA helicase DDX3X
MGDIRYCDDVRQERSGPVRKDGWFGRQDGRRPGGYQLTELEVFGERKESTGGIDFSQYDKIPVEVSGDGCEDFKTMDFFRDGNLSEALSWNLERCGYDRPTPVQRHAIPIVTSGRDLMACAQTGSGKTCAFMVPCIESLLRSGPPGPDRSKGRPTPSPCALVMAPTRELAVQIHEESMKFMYNTGIESRIVYGGADIGQQMRELNKGTDILVATPGRLWDMLGRQCVDLGLCQFLILDEADRMLDMGFEPQVRDIVEHSGMSRKLERRRQSMMFSATFAGSVQKMAGDFLADYLFITVGRVGSCSETIHQSLIYAEEGRGKTRALEKIYRENAPPAGFLTVIFVDSKKKADEIELDLWNGGLRACAIHGDRDQHEREMAMAAFKSGETPILVATDVAARGLDISNVGLVINFDMPKQMDDYVHRIGRTGRAGKKGVAIGFVNERCKYCNELADLLRQANQEVPTWLAQLAKENQANYLARKGGGKGLKGAQTTGSKDVRELAKAAAKAAAEAPKEPPKPKEPPRPKTPPREVPDAWDDDSD